MHDDRRALYASPSWVQCNGEPAAPAALADADGLVLPQRDGRVAPWALEPAGSDPPERWQGLPKARALVNSPIALLRLAAAGLGIVAAADWVAAAQVTRGELVRVLPQWCLPPVPAWVMFPGRRLMPAKTRVFVEALEQALNVR